MQAAGVQDRLNPVLSIIEGNGECNQQMMECPIAKQKSRLSGLEKRLSFLAPRVRLELTTVRLTAGCSAD